MNMAGSHPVQQRPNLVVTRDLLHPKQAFGVTAPLASFQVLLMDQKGGALGKEDRKSTHASIDHVILSVLSSPMIGKFPKALLNSLDQTR